MAKAGAKLKLTKTVAKNICDAIQIGTPVSAAAVYGGVSYRTFLYWMQMGGEEAQRLDELIEAGENDPQPDEKKAVYLQFFRKVGEAKAEAAATWSQTLSDAASKDPTWARYMLSKHYPEAYGDQPQKIELTGKDGGAIKHEDAAITDEARISRLLALVDRARENGSREADSGTGEPSPTA